MSRKPNYSGTFRLTDVEPASKLVLTAEMEKRRLEVEGQVKSIGFRGKIDKADGLFSETIGITLSWTYARDAYIVSLMPASILFSSIAVECAINNDSRMMTDREKQYLEMQKNHRSNPSDWLMLSNVTLRKARANTLPVDSLLDKAESIDTKNAPTAKFIKRRNLIAHGDYRHHMVGFESDYGGPTKVLRKFADVPGSEALDQFLKASTFLNAWMAQGPDLSSFW